MRLDRALHHKKEFARIWNGFLNREDAEPYWVSVTVDPTGRGIIHVEPEGFPKDELSLVFGEMLYQLRAALDSLVHETAIVVCGEDPPPRAGQLEFPISASPESFKRSARKIAPLADHHKVWIEDMQPYHDEHLTEGIALTANALDEINDLARRDRHRGLRVIASWGANRNPQFDLPPGCSLEWVHVAEDGLLEHESQVAEFQIRNWKPGLEIHANPNLTIDVTVEDASPPADDEDTLDFRATNWITIVRLLVEGFEKSLDGDPRTL
jgi:hypothetical protein